MLTAVPVRTIVGAIILVALSVTAVAALAYALWKWRSEARNVQLPTWRRVILVIGLIAVALQAALFVAFWLWPSTGRDYMLFGSWARWVHLSFVIALPCLFAGKGPSRWWLLASSSLLFVICFFIVASK